MRRSTECFISGLLAAYALTSLMNAVHAGMPEARIARCLSSDHVHVGDALLVNTCSFSACRTRQRMTMQRGLVRMARCHLWTMGRRLTAPLAPWAAVTTTLAGAAV